MIKLWKNDDENDNENNMWENHDKIMKKMMMKMIIKWKKTYFEGPQSVAARFS